MMLRVIVAVVVTYHPDMVALCRQLKLIARQVHAVMLVDNASLGVEEIDELSEIAQVHQCESNVGIAKAQNIGIQKAIVAGADGIIFFDQDSVVPEGMIASLSQEFDRLSVRHRVGAVGPIYRDSELGFYYPVIRIDKLGLVRKIIPSSASEPIQVSCCISSGTLVPVHVLNDVGLLQQALFIDYVDTEWCLRAVAKGYEIFVVPDALMEHKIGDDTLSFGRWKVPVHSPFRRYYRLRNVFILAGLKHIPILLIVKEGVQGICHQLILVATQKGSRLAYARAGIKGLLDGLKLCASRRFVNDA
ncbi:MULTISPECIES: glycosyltransferase family 2 protein [Pseudomonas]|nr:MULTISPECIES: glycosyltransferase family 2 protein [Pseudomonas]